MIINTEKWKNKKKELNLTFDELADLAKISRRQIIYLFNGSAKNPGIETVQKIERALGLTTEQSSPDKLTNAERELLTAFRALNGSMQAYVLQIVKGAVSAQETTAKNETKNNIKKIGG